MHSTTSASYSTLILDLGDVFFSWSADTTTSLSPKALRRILSTSIWHEFERGHVSELDCYASVAKQLSVEPQEITQAFNDARSTIRANSDLIDCVKELKDRYGLSVYAMSNMSRPDYERLQRKSAEWGIFDEVFISADAGERKPDLVFFRHVLSRTGVDPFKVIFLDDNLDNVVSARSLGMHGIIFDNNAHVIQALTNLIGDPIERGQAFLTRNAGKLETVTNTGMTIADNFNQFLILDATTNRSLTKIVFSPRLYNNFQGNPIFTTETFPDDLDSTSWAWMVVNDDADMAQSVMDEMLSYRNSDGISLVYFDHSRPRIDPIVSINILNFFYSYGRGSELTADLDWVTAVLVNRAYIDGTRYYPSADAFPYFLSRLLSRSDELYCQIAPILAERLHERMGAEGDPLALAMRVLACASVGIKNIGDLKRLLTMQDLNGGWNKGWIWKYPAAGLLAENRGLTTALAINAIRAVAALDESRS